MFSCRLPTVRIAYRDGSGRPDRLEYGPLIRSIRFPDDPAEIQAAAQMLTRNHVDFVPIAEAEGRMATTLLLVYPPGIGTVLPGERIYSRAKPMLDYFKMFERSANLFPGFEAEIQGVYRQVEPDGRIGFHTYVAREAR